MVILGNTHITYGAMLRPRWLIEIAGFTLIVRFINLLVIVVFVFFDVALHVLFGYFAWGCCAGFVIHPKAYESQKVCYCHVIPRYLVVRHVLHNSIDFVKSESIIK